MMKFLTFALIVFASFCVTPARAQQVEGIAAIVNDDAISMTDVRDRLKLVLISSGLKDSPDIRARIMPQLIDGLIEDQLKLQEAKRNKLEVPQAEIDEGLAKIAEQNKFTPEQFREVMKKSGVPTSTLINQIKAQLAWNKVIGEVLRRRVDVNDRDVATRRARMEAKIGQTEYLAADIYLPLNDPKRNAEVQQFAQRMATELQAKKAPFGAVAAQFSKAAGADRGGTLGWVQQGQLPEALDAVLITMEEGAVSNPIRTQDGLHILNLQKKRTLSVESIPPEQELRNMVGMERLDREQQRLLNDLKSAAFIDRRV